MVECWLEIGAVDQGLGVEVFEVCPVEEGFKAVDVSAIEAGGDIDFNWDKIRYDLILVQVPRYALNFKFMILCPRTKSVLGFFS